MNKDWKWQKSLLVINIDISFIKPLPQREYEWNNYFIWRHIINNEILPAKRRIEPRAEAGYMLQLDSKIKNTNNLIKEEKNKKREREKEERTNRMMKWIWIPKDWTNIVISVQDEWNHMKVPSIKLIMKRSRA